MQCHSKVALSVFWAKKQPVLTPTVSNTAAWSVAHVVQLKANEEQATAHLSKSDTTVPAGGQWMGSSERMICGQVPPQINQWVSSNPHHLKVEEGGSLTNHNEMSTQSPKIIKAYRLLKKKKKKKKNTQTLKYLNNDNKFTLIPWPCCVFILHSSCDPEKLFW